MASVKLYNFEDMQLLFEPVDLRHMTQIKLCNDSVNVKILDHEDMQLIFNKEYELTFTKNGPSLYLDRNLMTKKLQQERERNPDGKTYCIRIDEVLEKIYRELMPEAD